MRRKIIGILGITALLAALIVPASVVLAQDVDVSVNAPAEVDAGDDFTATVDIANVENFNAGQYDVVFDDTVLRLDDVTAGEIDGTAIPVGAWNLIEAGRARVVQAAGGVVGVTGDGTLAELEFHVIGDPGDESDIDLENGLLGDNVGVEIEVANWLGDTVTVAGEAPPEGVVVTINAQAVVDAGDDFTAAVDIVNVENFNAGQYDVVFDDTVLRLDDVTAGEIDGTAIPVGAWNLIEAGRARVVQAAGGVVGVTGDGTLAELEFHVIGDPGDESDIDLENGLLGDNVGVEIEVANWLGDTVTVAGVVEGVVVTIDAPAEVPEDSDFTAAVAIDNVENLDVAYYEVVFDDTVLRLDDVTAGDIDGTEIPVGASNLVDGRVIIVQNVPDLAGASGDGTLAELQFHVIGDAGDESDIDLENGLLGDNVGVEIEAFWLDGAVDVVGGEFEETFGPTALAEGLRDPICRIPEGATNLAIELTTAASPGPDMDLELYDDGTCVIGDIGVIDSAPGGSYEGDDFGYSGYDGGEEYITADGPLGQAYDLMVFAYEGGSYTVTVYYEIPVGVDVTPPEIDIEVTASTPTVGEPVTVTVTATDPSGVAMVYFMVSSPWLGGLSVGMAAPQVAYEDIVGVVVSFGDEASLTFAPGWAGTYTVEAWAADELDNMTPEGNPVTEDFEVVA